jgi:hypothetical protein
MVASWQGALSRLPIGRGSNLDVPVREMARINSQMPADLQQRFVGWKGTVKARLITLVIRSQPGDLARAAQRARRRPVWAEALGKASGADRVRNSPALRFSV